MYDFRKSNFKEELFLTTMLTTSSEKEEKEKKKKEEEEAMKNLGIKPKLKLPLIIPKNSNSNISLTERVNINNYFSPENYHHYSESCNKYYPKLDPALKDIFSVKNMIIKNRKYNIDESKLISDLNRDQMIHRSPGMGMYVRIQKYNKINRKKPYKLYFSGNYNNYYYNNDRYIKKKKVKKIIKNNDSNLDKKDDTFFKKYTERKFGDEDDDKIRPLNELLGNYQSPSFKIKTIDHSQDLIKLNELENKTRDQKIINALIKSGDENLKFNIGFRNKY